jgi:serine/threonine-protein kinase
MVGAFGEVQVMDWGLAKILGAKEPEETAEVSAVVTTRAEGPGLSTQAGAVMGTYAYMAPEQARGQADRLDARADVFGLGAVLCTILTGQPPYTGSKEEVARSAMRGRLEAAHARLEESGADAELLTLAKACLAAERDSRPANAGAVAEKVAAYRAAVQERLRAAELERAAAQARAEQAQATARAERRARRLQAGSVAGAAAALVAVGLIVALIWTLTGHARALRQGVEADLMEAARLRDQARYAEARAVLGRAETRLARGGPANLAESVRQAERDLDLALRLEEIPLPANGTSQGGESSAAVHQAYREAFAGYGIDLDALAPAEAAERILASAIQGPLVVALDHWASLLTEDNDRTTRERLLAVADLADLDGVRADVRRVLAGEDLRALEELAGQLETGSSAPTSFEVVGRRLWQLHSAERAEEVLRRGQLAHSGDFWLNYGLFEILRDLPPRREEALGYLRAAVAVRPDSPAAHASLGILLSEQGKLAEAEQEYRAALRLNPDYAPAHNNLGALLAKQGRPAQAEVEYREAIRSSPALPEAHIGLGSLLAKHGKLAQAEAEFRAALSSNYKLPEVHNNLGFVLARQGKSAEAEQEYRAALRLNPDLIKAHGNLSDLLSEQGKFTLALEELQRYERLIPGDDPRLPQLQAEIRRCQALAELDRKLPDLLHNKLQPADTAEGLDLAWLCQQPYKQLYAAAARFYSDAFAAEPKLADDLPSGRRYDAACAAALAGCGQGKDATLLDDKERARLRQQALTWLQADLDAWAKFLDSATPERRVQTVGMLKHWQEDSDLAGVRGALAKLTDDERQDWTKLWADVDALLKRAQAAPKKAEPGESKPN